MIHLGGKDFVNDADPAQEISDRYNKEEGHGCVQGKGKIAHRK